MERISISVKGKVRNIGHIEGDVLVLEPKTKKKHYMKIQKGWGLATAVLENVVGDLDVKFIEFNVKDTGERLRVSPMVWMSLGKKAKYGGFEEQTFLKDDHFVRMGQ